MRWKYGFVAFVASGFLSFACLPGADDDEPDNKPPELANTSVDITPTGDGTIDILEYANDPEGDTLTIVDTGDPVYGTVAVVDNKLEYTPMTGMSGTDTFTVTITDGKNQVTVTVTVEVQPTGANQPPKANPDSASTETDKAVNIDVLANDTDPNAADTLSVDSFTDPQNGSVTENADKTLKYTPNPGFIGTDSFTYTVTDGNKGYAIGYVGVFVADADAIASDNMTREAVLQLLDIMRGEDPSEGFASVSTKFAGAMALDPTNKNPIFFKALSDFFLWLQEKMLSTDDAVGTGRVLYQKMGIENLDTSVPKTLQTMDLQEVDVDPVIHGDIINTFPTTGEIVDGFLYGEFVARLEQLLTELDAVPTDFEYAINLHDLTNWQDEPMTRWVDHGDVSAVQVFLCGLIADLNIALAIELGDVDPNDFDETDLQPTEMDDQYIIGLLETKYTTTLTPVTARWQAARDYADKMLGYYEECSEHVRNESPVQQDNGLITLGRDTFDTEAEKKEFLADEAQYRSFANDTVLPALYADSFTSTEQPDGTPIDPEDQVTVNLNTLFTNGINPRKLLFHTALIDDDGDPGTPDRKMLGLTSVGQYTTAMGTADGVLLARAGHGLTVNDAQVMMPLPLFVMEPATFSSWNASGMTQIGLRPFAFLDAPRPDVGEIFVAVDATNLYIYITANIKASPFTYYEIEVEGEEDGEYVYEDTYNPSGSITVTGQSGTTRITVPLTNFPLSNGVEIDIDVEWPEPGDPYDHDDCSRGNIFVVIK